MQSVPAAAKTSLEGIYCIRSCNNFCLFTPNHSTEIADCKTGPRIENNNGSRIENNNNNNNNFFFYLSLTVGTVKWSIQVKTSYLTVINVAMLCCDSLCLYERQ